MTEQRYQRDQVLPRGLVLPTTRQCNSCGQTKPLTAEHWYERKERHLWDESRWHSQCRECQKARARKIAAANPDRHRQATQRRRVARALQEAQRLRYGALLVDPASEAGQRSHQREVERRAHAKWLREQCALLDKTLPKAQPSVNPFTGEPRGPQAARRTTQEDSEPTTVAPMSIDEVRARNRAAVAAQAAERSRFARSTTNE